ncbi:MAG: hypothetical protein R3B70_21920 [Polyangiaceae bacterium]
MVLMFGIACLLAGIIAAAFTSPLILSAPGTYAMLAIMSLPILAATLIEWRQSPPSQAGSSPAATAAPPATGVDVGGEGEVGAYCQKLRGLLVRSAVIKHPTFVRNRENEQDGWTRTAEGWSRGTFSVHGARYNDVLLELYTAATRTVFATSIPDYSETWDSNFGERLLRAHQTNGHQAHVDRVFVFQSSQDVTEEAVRQMTRQKDAGIRVRVYIDDDDPAFQFPPNISRDFTVIDDAIVGTTRSYGRQGEGLEAVWEFSNEVHLRQVQHVREKLLAGSQELEAFLKGYGPRKEIGP